jgi:hypothetical protein
MGRQRFAWAVFAGDNPTAVITENWFPPIGGFNV